MLGGRSALGGIEDIEAGRQPVRAVDAMAHPAVLKKTRRFISGVSCTVSQNLQRIVSILRVLSTFIQNGRAFFFCADYVSDILAG
jgi:hypothetical protein